MLPRLVALAGPLQGKSFELQDEPVTLGRHADNQVCVRQFSVSHHHCVLEPENGGYGLRDLDSLHGTFVNNRAVARHHLAHGDLLTVGESVFLFVEREVIAEDELSPVELGDSEVNGTSTVRLRPEEAFARLPRALSALLAISQAIHACRTAADLGRELLDQLFAAVPAERGALLLCERSGELVPTALRSRSEAPRGTWRVSRTLTRQVLEEGAALLTNDVAGSSRVAGSESLDSLEIRSVLCVPLPHRESPLGVLYLDISNTLHARFDVDHLELVTAAAAITAVALETARRMEWLEAERRRLAAAEVRHDLVGESPAMHRIYKLIARVAPTDSTVLLTGESGCGKELVARALHASSLRADRPFIAVDCATLSETLLESELFGHEKGAFTGAIARHVGKFELADGGTLFLDEVGEIYPPLQSKLLRVLQERKLERLGGCHPIPVDARMIVATNRDLRAAIERGGFREDLYYRLNVIEIAIPPLRERREDVPLLLSHFLHLHGRTLKRPTLALSPEARAALLVYDWPGNVRELANAVERAVVLAEGEVVRPEDLPEALFESGREREAPTSYHAAMNEHKRRLILDAVAGSHGNITHAAESLGLSRNYLHRLINNLGLRSELERD